jgi:hypothetical protein
MPPVVYPVQFPVPNWALVAVTARRSQVLDARLDAETISSVRSALPIT